MRDPSTGVAWRLEWRLARARGRALALNVIIPLVLVAPIALSDAPPHHAAAVYSVLFVLFGTFGSAIPLVRDVETGILERIAMTGLPPRRWIVERLLAQSAIDTLQLAPALALIAIVGLSPGAPGDVLTPAAALLAVLLATTFGALVTANALGAWIAGIARSLAEGALFCAVAGLFALHAAGVFRTPPPDSWAALIERAVPFAYLHEALLQTTTGAVAQVAQVGGTGGTAGLAAGALAALAGGLAALAISAAAAPWLVGRS